MREAARQPLPKQPVAEEQRADHRQRRPHHPPCRLEHQRHDHGTDHEIRRRRITRAHDQITLEDPVIKRQHKPHASQRPVVPRNVHARTGAARGKQRERQQQQKADMQRAQHLTRQRTVGRGVHLKHRERDRDRHHRPQRHPLRVAPVVRGVLQRQRVYRCRRRAGRVTTWHPRQGSGSRPLL